LTGNFSWEESGRILSGSSTTYYSQMGEASGNAGSCVLNQGYIAQGSQNLTSITAGLAAVNVSPNGRVVLSGIGGAPTFFYLCYMDGAYIDGYVVEGSSQTGKIGSGELDDQNLPAAGPSLPTSMLLNSATPKQTSQFDASGTLNFSSASGAMASVTGTVDHAGAGIVSYGDTFGPWTLLAPNGYGVSQAVDGSGNSLGLCVIDWSDELECLPNGLEPNGDTPTALFLIRH
jgi:hypothetical protein